MRKSVCLMLALLVLSNGSLLAGQSPQPQTGKPPQPQSPPTPVTVQDEDEEGVVRIGTSLVQIDAIVTDRDGKVVNDLTADDFEIFENKKKQTISNFSFVSLDDPKRSAAPSKSTSGSSYTPPKALQPKEVKRTIVVIVDDATIEIDAVPRVRNALKEFILNQVGPNDLVGLIRTKSGSGTLQQLTNNKKLFLAGIEKIWPGFIHLKDERNKRAFTANFVLQNAIRSLKDVPGRKSVILFSYGFPIGPELEDLAPTNPQSPDRPAIGQLLSEPVQPPQQATSQARTSLWDYQNLAEQAARASVTVYPIDMAGLETLNFDAVNPQPYNPQVPQSFLRGAGLRNYGRQEGIRHLARDTGGIPFVNTNGFNEALHRVMQDQSGYYLLGYSPDESAFTTDKKGNRPFRSISVKVKRPGLTVRSRRGFLGVTDSELKRYESPEAKLVQTLVSPFKTNGIDVRLTSVFLNENSTNSKSKGIVRSLLYFEGKGLTFTDEADGWKKAEVGLFAMMFDSNGDLVQKVGRTQTLRLRGKSLETALNNGFVFTLDLPIPNEGTYQIKAAVKDNASLKIGSASQLVETPKLEKDHVCLSGLILSGLETKSAPNSSPQLQPSEAPTASPAVREFVRGGGLSLSCFVYNAVNHPQTKQPAVTARIKLFRDGKEVYSGQEFNVPISPNGMVELSRAIALADSMETGDYTAVVTVTDLYQTDSKRKTATQTLDFTLVEATSARR